MKVINVFLSSPGSRSTYITHADDEFLTICSKENCAKSGYQLPNSKTDALQAVAKLIGLDEISVDVEKGTLSVIGDVGPVLVTERLRRIGKIADIVSVGPPKPPPPPVVCLPLPPRCNNCQLVAVGHSHSSAGVCSIM